MKRDAAIAAVHDLQQFLRESRLVWTTETPTREGYYWLRSDKNDFPEVVRISVDYGENDTPFVVQSGHPANTGVQYLRDFKGVGCQWAGPLEVPTS